MKIATLQFAPRLGDVEGNIRRADELLKRGKDGVGIEVLKPEILVLPELAFSGYNFSSLEAIKPYLEPQGAGPTAKWAQETAKRLRCKVCVGYPEVEKAVSSSSADDRCGSLTGSKCFNSLLVVDENGVVLHNYRKRFLYYTDVTWASEGDADRGFHSLIFDERSETLPRDPNNSTPEAISCSHQKQIPTTFGICMDINPYRFEAPFTAWEFANRVLNSKSQLVIISMAWLTLLSHEELMALRGRPEMDTFQYWIRRFWPLLEKRMEHDGDVDGGCANGSAKKVVIVFANRAGEEKGEEGKDPARYAGTSAVVAVTQKPCGSRRAETSPDDGDDTSTFDVEILCWDIIGAVEEEICFADTQAEPKMVFGLAKPAEQSDESE